MFGQSFARILLLPVVVAVLAGTIALAEQQSQPSSPEPSSATSSPISNTDAPTTDTAPVTESTPDGTTVAPSSGASTEPADSTTQETPVDQPKKKHKGHKDEPVLDPVGEGKMLFETRCATCHSVPRPNTHTLSEWPECLNRMAPRSFLRDSDVKLMLLYLKHELKPASTSEWDNKEGSLSN